MFFLIKIVVSGALVAIVSSVSRRYPGLGGLVAALPLVSILGMLWLWAEKPDVPLMASHVRSTFWFVLPSLPMFLLIPALLERGYGFYTALGLGCLLTVALFALVIWLAPRLGFVL